MVDTTFNTGVANQFVRVIFNAECAIGGATTYTWLNVDILVDGQALNPSGNDNALCTSNNTLTTFDGWVSAVTQAFGTVASAGVHTVQVRVTPTSPDNAEWVIDDLSLVIDTQ